ncbi:hypothetical protein [Methylobacterium sp. NEAU K]|uniref:hypothetical protein n=1 Tax=Methylobacterium sp. NEAU K TaxID=3064946 RepID=UPI0027344825|nr:hypothetical protein [Methylobacterium sp. NEAU K]MDP4003274.1 hypothetical protein [Methylobacterium sp. NEAU K]
MSFTIPKADPPNLFTAAGIPVDAEAVQPKRKRASRPRKPTPAENAEADRVMGGRGLRGPLSPGQRSRVGTGREI